MNESVSAERCGDVSSLCTDLSNLVTWAHTHGNICTQIPALEAVQTSGRPGRDDSILWICAGGHAYHWPCGKLHFRSKESEAVEKRKRLMSSEAPPREASSGEKRIRVTSAFERARTGTVATGSRSRSPGVTQQRDDRVCVVHNELAPRENPKRRKSMRPCFAAEQRAAASRGEVKADVHTVKLGSDEDLQIISDEEEHTSDAESKGDRISQNIPTPVSCVTAEVDWQTLHDQKSAISKQPATHTAGFAPTEKPPLTLPSVLKSPVSNQKILESSFVRQGPRNPEEFTSETSRARTSTGPATPKEELKQIPVSNAEVKSQPESPTSVTFFQFEASVDVQQQLHLCCRECGTPGTGFSGSAAGNPPAGTKPAVSELTPWHSASPSPESKNPDHPYPDKNRLKKRNRNASDIKIFRDWLALHCPSEAREIYKLPPEDLDNYLAWFYSSAKKQNGMDFSANSLYFFQSSIDRYLKDHNYEYSVVKGAEFRTSQEALKLKHQHLSQKEREGEWTILENLTDENVDVLRKNGLLSQMTPQGFLHLMLINIIRGFGASTHNQSQNLYWGQLVLRKDEAGLEYLQWKNDLHAEEAAGEAAPHLFARPDNPDTCPIQDYKKYAKKRPLDMLHDYDPLYLSPKPLYSVWDQVWYCRKSLTKSKMEKMLKGIIQLVKGTVKKAKK